MDSQGKFKKKLVDTNQRLIRTDPRILKVRAVTSVLSKIALLVVFGTCFFSRNLINQANQQMVQFKNSTTVKEFNNLEKYSSLVYSRATLTGHKDLIYSIAFSPDGRTLASTSYDETIKLWDLQSKKEIANLTGPRGYVGGGIAFSPDRQTLAFASRNKTIKLWDLQSKKEIATLTGHSKEVTKVVFSPDGQTLASTGDNTIKLWKVPSQKESNRQPVPIIGDLFSRLWNMQSHNFIASFENEHFTRLSGFSSDGQTLIISDSYSGRIIMWDWRQNKKVISTLTGLNKWKSIAFSPDAKSVVVNRHNKNNYEISVWDLLTKKVIAILADSCGETHPSLVFSTDSKMLAWSTRRGGNTTIGLWDVQSQKQRGSLLIGETDNPKDNLVFSPDGKMLALSTGNDITLTPIDSSNY